MLSRPAVTLHSPTNDARDIQFLQLYSSIWHFHRFVLTCPDRCAAISHVGLVCSSLMASNLPSIYVSFGDMSMPFFWIF